MKICLLQPRYSYDGNDVASCFSGLLALLDECDESLDLIVLPEYSDVPADVHGRTAFLATAEANRERLLTRAAKTARRCHAMLFVNATCPTEGGIRNTTYAFNREGKLVGRYFKAHPAPSEVRREDEGGYGLDVAYSYEEAAPYILELEGLRFGFMTCYDFYFYEGYARLAREGVDIIIGCSLQRTDTHDALSIIHRFLAYQTNAYLVRASVSLGEDACLSGCSTVVSPRGEVLIDMKSRAGRGICEIDPHEKYFKPAGHGGAPAAHYEYMEVGRRPWLYRVGGPSVVPFESVMPYPRLSALRGLTAVAPENSLPALGAAVSLGAEEVALDLSFTRDGVPVICRDGALCVSANTYRELLSLDIGEEYGEGMRGLTVATLADVLKKFAGQAILNLRVEDGKPLALLAEAVALIRRYDCARHFYFTAESDATLRYLKEIAPDIPLCVRQGAGADPMAALDRALALGAEKVELPGEALGRETVATIHEKGIICNVLFTGAPEGVQEYLDRGVDCILTSNYLAVKNACAHRLSKERRS